MWWYGHVLYHGTNLQICKTEVVELEIGGKLGVERAKNYLVRFGLKQGVQEISENDIQDSNQNYESRPAKVMAVKQTLLMLLLMAKNLNQK